MRIRNKIKLGRQHLTNIGLIISFSVATLFFGCDKALAVTEIEFWQTMNNEESKTLTDVISKFEKLNPDIKIKAQSVPFSDAQNKFKIAAGAGNAPDVFRAEIAWIAELAELGFLFDLSATFAKDDQKDFLASPMAYGQYKGKIWAVPQGTDCLALLYNKDMFSKAGLKVPEDLSALITAGQKLSDPKNGTYALGLNPESYWVQAFIWAYGGQLIDVETRKAKISDKESLSGVQFFVDLHHKYKIASPEVDFVNGYNNMMTAFKQGKTAMIINGPWSTSDILTGSEFKGKNNLGVARIPKGPSGYGSPVGGNSLVIFAGSKKKEAAYKFIQFLTSTENQVTFAGNHNWLPTRSSAYQSPVVKNNEILQGFKNQIEVARNRPVIPEGARIYTSFDKGVQEVLTQSKTPAKAMKGVAKKWDRMLR